jgi:hypothetical protein
MIIKADGTVNETRRPPLETGTIQPAERRIVPAKGDHLLGMV